jgi:hypothetical protein
MSLCKGLTRKAGFFNALRYSVVFCRSEHEWIIFGNCSFVLAYCIKKALKCQGFLGFELFGVSAQRTLQIPVKGNVVLLLQTPLPCKGFQVMCELMEQRVP